MLLSQAIFVRLLGSRLSITGIKLTVCGQADVQKVVLHGALHLYQGFYASVPEACNCKSFCVPWS